MSKNAAQLLLELFDKWFESDGSPTGAGNRKNEKNQWLAETRLAVQYLDEIELFIRREGIDNPAVRRIQPYINKYWSWIFARQYGWTGENSRARNYISRAEIDALDGLASKPINLVGNPSRESMDRLRDVLPELIQEVDDDESLGTALKQYVKTVLVHAFEVLSLGSSASSFNQQNALNSLVSALGLAGFQSKNESKRTKWNAAAYLALSALAGGFFGEPGAHAYNFTIERAPETVHQITSSLHSAADDIVDAD